MADKEIKCEVCFIHLGVIRDARLRKGIVHLCQSCDNERKAERIYARHTAKKEDEYEYPGADLLNDFFGKKRY